MFPIQWGGGADSSNRYGPNWASPGVARKRLPATRSVSFVEGAGRPLLRRSCPEDPATGLRGSSGRSNTGRVLGHRAINHRLRVGLAKGIAPTLGDTGRRPAAPQKARPQFVEGKGHVYNQDRSWTKQFMCRLNRVTVEPGNDKPVLRGYLAPIEFVQTQIREIEQQIGKTAELSHFEAGSRIEPGFRDIGWFTARHGRVNGETAAGSSVAGSERCIGGRRKAARDRRPSAVRLPHPDQPRAGATSPSPRGLEAPPLSQGPRSLVSAATTRHGAAHRHQTKGSKATTSAPPCAETMPAGPGRPSCSGPRAVWLPVGEEAASPRA